MLLPLLLKPYRLNLLMFDFFFFKFTITYFWYTNEMQSLQGVGGIMELAPGYLPAVYSTIRKAGGLCIADEVQSGFARTGSHFWGFEAHGVVPDIVTMAKVVYLFQVSRVFVYGLCYLVIAKSMVVNK